MNNEDVRGKKTFKRDDFVKNYIFRQCFASGVFIRGARRPKKMVVAQILSTRGDFTEKLTAMVNQIYHCLKCISNSNALEYF